MKILLFFITISLSSCGTFHGWFYGSAKIAEVSKNICLNGEGVGRIGTSDDSYSFDYQSALRGDKWLLGIQFPLRGEELLVVNYSDQKYFLSGDFFLKLERKIAKESPDKLEMLDLFSKELSMFIEELAYIKKDPLFFNKCEKKGLKYECKNLLKNRAKRVTIWHQGENEIQFEKNISKKFKLTASFKYPSSQGFKQIDIKLKQVVQKDIEPYYYLGLSNKNCI